MKNENNLDTSLLEKSSKNLKTKESKLLNKFLLISLR